MARKARIQSTFGRTSSERGGKLSGIDESLQLQLIDYSKTHTLKESVDWLAERGIQVGAAWLGKWLARALAVDPTTGSALARFNNKKTKAAVERIIKKAKPPTPAELEILKDLAAKNGFKALDHFVDQLGPTTGKKG